MKPFFDNSRAKRRVIFSNSWIEYSFGLSFKPALAPPNGTSTQAHLNVIKADRALTSSRDTSREYRIPCNKIRNEKNRLKTIQQ